MAIAPTSYRQLGQSPAPWSRNRRHGRSGPKGPCRIGKLSMKPPAGTSDPAPLSARAQILPGVLWRVHEYHRGRAKRPRWVNTATTPIRCSTAMCSGSPRSWPRIFCARTHGSLVDKAQFLAQIARPVTISRLSAQKVKVRILGEVAIIHARTSYTTAKGEQRNGRDTDVWARGEGKWLAVSAHVTR